MKLATSQLDTEARRLLGRSYRELGAEQRRVVFQIVRRGVVARNPLGGASIRRPGVERLEAAAGRVVGSWGFVVGLIGFLAAWMLIDGLPQPGAFPSMGPILILSILAIETALIMMSLNRQARRESERAAHDYEVKLKLELEILALHEKIEAMRDRELADVLAHQVELLQELRDRPRSTAA